MASSAFASAGLVIQRRGRVTELRVTIVVALGLAGAIALWLSAVWLAGAFNFALNTHQDIRRFTAAGSGG
jgi:hypothetical protein